MSATSLHDLLDALPDTRELVLRAGDAGDPVLAAWRSAAGDARDAYDAWCARPGPETHAAYLAAEDRADAAAALLAADRAAGCHAPRRLAA